ncbi:Opioid-binding protein/cell adhesion molecule like [Pseudolycoriella hygida]|uniref:Opioid-binding protein/cell adhesion molecule like n=1 Tax=Pseudolycoriella hygida TaxID=35572 RepID=A0A9Q0S957_9DIPT|nr:Opioid-binding protein/cell adhesion molecule like [Pseudolycoriella hygida]
MSISLPVTKLIFRSDYVAGDPNFSSPIQNVTVPLGREAVLTCVVHDLVAFKVAWLRVDTQTILTIQNHVITKNHRIGLSHSDNRIWQLRIRDVKESDRGWYMCQVNTDPMKSQTGYLDVVVPPDILDYQTSHDMIVEEGENVTLTCTAAGSPAPTIEWRREKGKPLLSIESKEIAPAIWIRQDVVYSAYGQKVMLECVTESHPNSVNFWLHNKEYVQGGTYESLTMENIFKVVMKLIVRPLDPSDFGEYTCVGKNPLGQSEKTVVLHHKSKMVGDLHSNQPASQISNSINRSDWDIENSTSTHAVNSISLSILTCVIAFCL